MKDRVASSASSPQARIQLETQITKWADRIIAATPAEHAQLRWLYRASRKKISVVPPGVDLEQFHPMQEQVAKAHFGLPDDTQLLLFVGRIEPLKGVETAIQALALIRDRHPSVARRLRFMIVGGNPGDPSEHELAQLQTLVSQLDLTEIVEFAGAREQSQLPEFYAAATAVIMPSDYESFGMVALEAMASGTPVIASEVGGLAFLIQNGKTGFLVPTRDPDVLAHRILTLLENPEELQQMRLAAAELARQYAWSTIAENLLKVFADVAENPKAIRRMR
jgi:D-inositol-3-phosphate glycosyltransferase